MNNIYLKIKSKINNNIEHFKSFLGLCCFTGCYRRATEHIDVFCVRLPVCKKHYRENYVSDEDIFDD